MCGILGFVGEIKVDKKDDVEKLITAIFVETEVRGSHASGYASMVNSGKNISWSKMPVPSTMFVDHDRYYHNQWQKHPTMFIGHCRYATSGKPSINSNNHPFSSADGNLWMVHNGTCVGLKHHIMNTTKIKTECDSEYILRIVEENGWDNGIQKIVNSSADFALIFIDKAKNELRFIRNEKRPLWLINCKKEYGIDILCSTKEIFELAKEKCGIKKNFQMVEVDTNTLYSINLETMKMQKNVFKRTESLWSFPNYNTQGTTKKVVQFDYQGFKQSIENKAEAKLTKKQKRLINTTHNKYYLDSDYFVHSSNDDEWFNKMK